MSSGLKKIFPPLLAALLMAGALFGGARLSSNRSFQETYRFQRPYILGEADAFVNDGLRLRVEVDGRPCPALKPGQKGALRYRFFRRSDEKMGLRISAPAWPDTAVMAAVNWGEEESHFFPITPPAGLAPGTPFTREIRMDEEFGDTHYFYVNVEAQRKPGPGEARPVLLGMYIAFEDKGKPPLSWRGLLFFGLCGFGAWWGLLGFGLPRMRSGLKAIFSAFPLSRNRRLAALALTLVFLAVAGHPVWWSPKLHDDRWALSNSRLLALDNFHSDALYFRSRVRPAFPAFALPMQTLLEHPVANISLSPSDFYQRLFTVVDRAGVFWDTRIYPEASLLGVLLLLAGIGLLAPILNRQGLRGLFPLLLAGYFWFRMLGTHLVSPISLSATWFFQMLALTAFFEALGGGSEKKWLRAGFLTGLAFLFKESAAALLLPMGLLMLGYLARGKAERKRWIALACWVGAAALGPLFYFGLVLPSGFQELWGNFNQHLQSQTILTGYHTRSFAGLGLAFWEILGPAFLLVTVGLIVKIRQGFREHQRDAWMGVWLLGGLTVLLLPWFYTRFFAVILLPLAWLGGEGLWWLGQKAGIPGLANQSD